MSRVAVIFALCLLLAGCGKCHTSPAKLSAEDARHALIDWVETSHDPVLEMSLDFLRTEPMHVQSTGQVSIGAYSIDLPQQSFVVTAIGDEVFSEYCGRFVYNASTQRWKAVIETTKQT